MIKVHDLLFLLAAFISEFLGTLGGFGSSTFFVPLAALLEPFEVVLILTSLLHVFSNISKIYLFRKDFEKKYIFQLALPAIAMTLLGAYFVGLFDPKMLSRFVGYVLLFLLVLQYFFNRKKVIYNPVAGRFLSALSGLLTGLFGTGGAIRALALSSIGLTKNSFIITSASIDLFGDLGRLIIYIQRFHLSREHWFYIPLLIAIGWLGSWFGKVVLMRVDEEKFKLFVKVAIFLVALFTIAQDLLN